jgi:hypothetical protein
MLITNSGYALVPELCMITGLSEAVLNSPSKFNMIREVIKATEPDN